MKRSRNQSKPPAPASLILEEVVGLTTTNGNGLASSASSSKFAYIAGCVVVLHDVHSGTRSHLIVPNRVPKPLSCVTLSCDASIIAAGESGHQPGVLIWNSTKLAFIYELRSHQYGVTCMAFSPDGKLLVSVGCPRDGCICFWDWKNKSLAAKIKISSVSCPTSSIEFSLDNKFIVTADKNQLKFWKVRWSKGCRAGARSTLVVIMHNKVDLGINDSTFVAVTSMSCMDSSSANHIQADEQGAFYAVTEKGMLCMVDPSSSVIKSVELEVVKCFALSASRNLVGCACNEGVVKLYRTNSLEYAGQLLYAEVNRCNKSTIAGYGKIDMEHFELQNKPTSPDALACQFLTPEKLVVVYGDHSLYIWDIHNIDQATRCCVLVSHGGCIWDIKNVPCENMHDSSLSCVAKGCSGGLSFATCSVDGNIKLWDFVQQSELSEKGFQYSGDVISNGDECLVNAGIFERDSIAQGFSPPGFRSVAVSSDGKYLAAGDCQGNIHIFDLYTSNYFCIKDAHGSEIRSLSFNLADKNGISSSESSERYLYLASGGQDGQIHLYDAGRNFNHIGTIDYHPSAVTLVKVSSDGRRILICTDRSLILHGVDLSSTECKFSCLQRIATNGTIYDMDINPQMNVAFTVGEDKKLSVYDIASGKQIKLFKCEAKEDAGDPLKVTIDGSHSFLACSYSNRSISIYDYISGRIVAQATGHSKAITGMIFLPDCKHLVSVGAEGCIFVWRLPSHISSRMLHRTEEIFFNSLPESMRLPKSCNDIKTCLTADEKWKDHSEGASSDENLNKINEEMLLQEDNSLENARFKFSISRLPKWAQCKVGPQKNPECLVSESVSRNALESDQQFSGTLSGSLPQTESSGISPSPTFSRTSENRWLTIHTVCMGWLDSPETCDLKDLNMQISATESISQSKRYEMIHPNKRIKLNSSEPCINNPPEESNSEQHSQLRLSNSLFSLGTNNDADASRKDSQESENYKTNSNALSVQLKKDEDKLSTVTSSSSQFPAQRDLPEVGNKSLSVHAAEDSTNASLRLAKRSANFLSVKSSESLTDAYTSNSLTEVTGNAPSHPLWQLDNDKVEELEIMRSCEEALHNLEAAAEIALQSFCKLATVNTGEEKTGMAEVQLAEAARRLPSIEKKIQVIAKSLQAARNLQQEK